MKSPLRRMLSWLPMVAIALTLAACGDQGQLLTEPALGSEGAQFARDANGRANGKAKGRPAEKGPKAKGRKNGRVGEYRLAVGQLPEGRLKDEAVVYPDRDALLGAAGHVLLIPAGTVDEPTTFTIKQVHMSGADGEVVVGVDLSAYRIDADGNEIDVGEAGFKQPVYLGLTYTWASNMSDADRDRATVLWMKSAVEGEEMTIHSRHNWRGGSSMVVAELNHFSQYALAFP